MLSSSSLLVRLTHHGRTVNIPLVNPKTSVLTIRLSRIGKKRQPSFRLVLQDKRNAVKGKAKEILGHFHPTLKDKPLVLSRERIEYLIKMGARPSDSVATLLKKHDFSGMEKFMEPRNKKRLKKGEEEKKTEAAPTPPAA